MMASLMATELARIRRLISDRKVSELSVPSSLLEELMFDVMDEISREVGAGDIVQIGFATVGPSSSTVTVSSSYPAMRFLKHLVRESDGFVLEKCSHEEILALREGGGDRFGDPVQYTLVPGPNEDVLLEVSPTPENTVSLTGVWEPVPSAVTPIAGNIYLEPTGLLALRNRVAGRALLSLTPEKLAELGRSPEYAGILLQNAEKAVMDEWSRMHVGEIQDHVIRSRR